MMTSFLQSAGLHHVRSLLIHSSLAAGEWSQQEVQWILSFVSQHVQLVRQARTEMLHPFIITRVKRYAVKIAVKLDNPFNDRRFPVPGPPVKSNIGDMSAF